jgi:hypothetical protein
MKEKKLQKAIPGSEILLYQTEDGRSEIQVRLEDGTVWLTQAQMADLFQTTPQNITLHIRNIYDEAELMEETTCKEYLQVRNEGTRAVNRPLKHYNLEVVLAVGYRVHSHRGTQFRRWATEHLREYLTKGFLLNDERLKDIRNLGPDYFDDLLLRIRDIRASEKRFYQKIRDIYKLAVDYDPKAEETLEFFKIVQNKLHWAVTGMTAAELIAGRADSAKPNMGLTSWSGSRVRQHDVAIAKNYLNADELNELNRIVVMYLDFAEDQARRRRALYMKDWREKLDAFLHFNEREILEHSGKVSMEVAQKLALGEYEKFQKRRLKAEAEEDDREFERLSKKVERKALKGRS